MYNRVSTHMLHYIEIFKKRGSYKLRRSGAFMVLVFVLRCGGIVLTSLESAGVLSSLSCCVSVFELDVACRMLSAVVPAVTSSGTKFCTARTNDFVPILISATRILPSLPGKTLVTKPNFHCRRFI